MLSSLFLSKPSLHGISDQYSVMLADSRFQGLKLAEALAFEEDPVREGLEVAAVVGVIPVDIHAEILEEYLPVVYDSRPAVLVVYAYLEFFRRSLYLLKRAISVRQENRSSLISE